GWLAEGAFDGRERGFDARPAALALQTLDQPRLLAADVSARAAMEIDVEIEALAEDVFAGQIIRVQLINRLLQDAKRPAVFVAEVNVGDARARGVAGEQDTFEDLMRIFLHEDAVVEGARLALVGVDAQVDGPGMVLRQEGPFDAGRKARAAATAQTGILHD